MPVLNLKAGEEVKVFGPASITVLTGMIDIVGREFKAREKAIVNKFKSYVVRALSDASLDLILGPEAFISGPEPGEVYDEWVSRAEEIISKAPKLILVLGGVDDGKSTLSTLLLNKALDRGLKPAIIDADVGQADIGPPGFISMSYPSEKIIWLRELKPHYMRFIGDIKPQNFRSKIIFKIRELVVKALSDNRSPVIIDTDGWIGDVIAVAYKSLMIEELMPDEILVIGDDNCRIFKRYDRIDVNTTCLKTPVIRRTRSREDRRILRADRYREFLAEAKIIKIPMDNVIITGHPVFTGEEVDAHVASELSSASIVYASRVKDTLYLVVSGGRVTNFDDLKRVFNIEKIRYYAKGFETNTYIGLTTRDGNDYPGLLLSIDYATRTINIKTLYTDIKPIMIKLSFIKINEKFMEEPVE
jgi:polynucleotide 5'-hydroxyl-kinase GRC3/NOL9